MSWRPIALLLVAASTAHAQIVNVQGAIAKPPAKNEVDGQVELKLAWAEGNAPVFDMAGAASVLWKHDDFLSLAQVRGEYGTAAGSLNTKKTFEHLRERYRLSCVWRWEAFAQHEYDEFKRLSLRALFGTGPALQILNEPALAMLAGASYMFEYIRLDRREAVSDSGRRFTGSRGSLYITGREQLAPNVAFLQTFYFQPLLEDASNFRLLGDAAIEVKLSKRFAIVDGFVVDYDSAPPDGVHHYDTLLKVGLVISI